MDKQCVIEDYGNQVLYGPCDAPPPGQAAAVLSLSSVLALAVIGAVWLIPAIDRRRTQMETLIHRLERSL